MDIEQLKDFIETRFITITEDMREMKGDVKSLTACMSKQSERIVHVEDDILHMTEEFHRTEVALKDSIDISFEKIRKCEDQFDVKFQEQEKTIEKINNKISYFMGGGAALITVIGVILSLVKYLIGR